MVISETRCADRLSDADAQLDLVRVPNGSAMIGASPSDPVRRSTEQPRTRVRFDAEFYMAAAPITFALFDCYSRDAGKVLADDAGFGRGARPAINISWLEAVDFCRWLSHQTGHAYRLPSEAAWEYACRAGSITPYATGETITTAEANFDPSGPDPIGFREQTTPVGAFAPNAWGLFDMHGNVAEWCADAWRPNLQALDRNGAPQPVDVTAPDATAVTRGGGWTAKRQYLRASERYHYAIDHGFEMIGFRVCRNIRDHMPSETK